MSEDIWLPPRHHTKVSLSWKPRARPPTPALASVPVCSLPLPRPELESQTKPSPMASLTTVHAGFSLSLHELIANFFLLLSGKMHFQQPFISLNEHLSHERVPASQRSLLLPCPWGPSAHKLPLHHGAGAVVQEWSWCEAGVGQVSGGSGGKCGGRGVGVGQAWDGSGAGVGS